MIIVHYSIIIVIGSNLFFRVCQKSFIEAVKDAVKTEFTVCTRMYCFSVWIIIFFLTFPSRLFTLQFSFLILFSKNISMFSDHKNPNQSWLTNLGQRVKQRQLTGTTSVSLGTAAFMHLWDRQPLIPNVMICFSFLFWRAAGLKTAMQRKANDILTSIWQLWHLLDRFFWPGRAQHTSTASSHTYGVSCYRAVNVCRKSGTLPRNLIYIWNCKKPRSAAPRSLLVLWYVRS